MILMDKLVVKGGKSLKGTVQISGSKNAVLPIMASTLLAYGTYRLNNVPNLRDVRTMGKLLESTGIEVKPGNGDITISNRKVENLEAPYELVKTMRASIYILGPMVARFGYARVSLPGGCAWGPRPVNLHIEGMKKLGAAIKLDGGYIIARARGLKGAHIVFDIPSVGATGTLLMAAVLAKGRTIIENAAREPEITSLIRFLNLMGADIKGENTTTLEIVGVDKLRPVDCDIIPDRIETATFLAACHLAGGELNLINTRAEHLTAVVEKLKESGAEVKDLGNTISIRSNGRPKPVDITTAVYPGFPTDMQAQWMALMSHASGTSVIVDKIFHDRFTHVAELKRLGADIKLDRNTAIVKGVNHLCGAPVMSTDLRASASLILAGLVAKGQTDISRVYHIDRGYENIEGKLRGVGAEIWRDHEELIT